MSRFFIIRSPLVRWLFIVATCVWLVGMILAIKLGVAALYYEPVTVPQCDSLRVEFVRLSEEHLELEAKLNAQGEMLDSCARRYDRLFEEWSNQ